MVVVEPVVAVAVTACEPWVLGAVGALGAFVGCCIRGRLTLPRFYKDRGRRRIEPGFLGTMAGGGFLALLAQPASADWRLAGTIGLGVAFLGAAAVSRFLPGLAAVPHPAPETTEEE